MPGQSCHVPGHLLRWVGPVRKLSAVSTTPEPSSYQQLLDSLSPATRQVVDKAVAAAPPLSRGDAAAVAQIIAGGRRAAAYRQASDTRLASK